MDDFTEGCRVTIQRGLAELFELLGHEENGIDARWYRLDSCKNEAVTPKNGSDSFVNPIPPLSQLFRLGKERTNDVLLACGILEVLKKGTYIGQLGVCLNVLENIRNEYKLGGLIEMEHVTRENLLGTRVWCIRVGSFRDGQRFAAGDQADRTRNHGWTPSRIRIRAALNELFYSIALPMVSVEAVVAAAKEEEEEESPEAASPAIGEEHQEKSTAAAKSTFEVNINAAFKNPVKYKATNGREQVLVRIPQSSTEASYRRNAQRIGWIRNILDQHAGEEVNSEESGVWLLEELHRLLPNSFKEVAARKGFTIPQARMPVNKTAAMWQDAEVDYRQSRSIGKHCNDYFQRPIFAKESDVRGISDGHMEPTVDSYKTDAKETIEYWYKLIDELLEHDIQDVLDEATALKMTGADMIVGGDHGKGRFRLVLMLILRLGQDPPIKKRFVLGEIDCKKDSVDILKKTFMVQQNERLRSIGKDKCFAITKDSEGKLGVMFTPGAAAEGRTLVIRVPSRVFVCGDLKFYMQVLGRENMDSVWCTYCDINLRKCLWSIATAECTQWTHEKMKAQLDKDLEGSARLGIVDTPLWDFTEVDHFLPTVLHMEIGIINNVTTRMEDFIEERIESLTEEEVAARNQLLTSEIAVDDCKDQLQQCTKEYGQVVAEIQYYKEQEAKGMMTDQERQNNEVVCELREEVREESDRLRLNVLPFAKKAAKSAREQYKSIRKKKEAADFDVRNHIEHKILVLKYKLKRAAYHGGKYNGVHARLILSRGDDIMHDINDHLNSCNHPTKKADDDEINSLCDLLKRLLRQLNIVFATLRMPHGTPTEECFTKLDEAIKEAAKLWKQLGLNYTPKFHLLHVHALRLMRKYNGFGEMLEDDLEKSHQDMDRIHRRIAGLGSCKKRALSISRKQKVQGNASVQAEVAGVLSRSKRRRKGPSQAEEKKKVAKTARIAKRKEDLATEKTKPAGPAMDDKERTKKEFRDNQS